MSDRSEATGNSRVSPDSGQKRLIDRLRGAIRSRGYSRRTEKTYWYWIRYFIHFHGKRHPAEMGAAEVTAFLSWLATERNVAAATQNQALSALLFLYKHVLGQVLPWLGEVVHAKRPVRLPVLLTEGEAARLPDQVEGGARLMVALLYGAGLRQAQCLALRARPGMGAGRASGPLRQAGDLRHAALIVRDATPRARTRHPHGAVAARALGCVDDDDLHARDEQGRARREEPARPAGAAARRLQDRGGSYLEPE